ncbi:Phosphatidylinositol kinase like protein, partial [Aduncisulcus paluster]
GNNVGKKNAMRADEDAFDVEFSVFLSLTSLLLSSTFSSKNSIESCHATMSLIFRVSYTLLHIFNISPLPVSVGIVAWLQDRMERKQGLWAEKINIQCECHDHRRQKSGRSKKSRTISRDSKGSCDDTSLQDGLCSVCLNRAYDNARMEIIKDGLLLTLLTSFFTRIALSSFLSFLPKGSSSTSNNGSHRSSRSSVRSSFSSRGTDKSTLMTEKKKGIFSSLSYLLFSLSLLCSNTHLRSHGLDVLNNIPNDTNLHEVELKRIAKDRKRKRRAQQSASSRYSSVNPLFSSRISGRMGHTYLQHSQEVMSVEEEAHQSCVDTLKNIQHTFDCFSLYELSLASLTISLSNIVFFVGLIPSIDVCNARRNAGGLLIRRGAHFTVPRVLPLMRTRSLIYNIVHELITLPAEELSVSGVGNSDHRNFRHHSQSHHRSRTSSLSINEKESHRHLSMSIGDSQFSTRSSKSHISGMASVALSLPPLHFSSSSHLLSSLQSLRSCGVGCGAQRDAVLHTVSASVGARDRVIMCVLGCEWEAIGAWAAVNAGWDRSQSDKVGEPPKDAPHRSSASSRRRGSFSPMNQRGHPDELCSNTLRDVFGFKKRMGTGRLKSKNRGSSSSSSVDISLPFSFIMCESEARTLNEEQWRGMLKTIMPISLALIVRLPELIRCENCEKACRSMVVKNASMFLSIPKAVLLLLPHAASRNMEGKQLKGLKDEKRCWPLSSEKKKILSLLSCWSLCDIYGAFLLLCGPMRNVAQVRVYSFKCLRAQSHILHKFTPQLVGLYLIEQMDGCVEHDELSSPFNKELSPGQSASSTSQSQGSSSLSHPSTSLSSSSSDVHPIQEPSTQVVNLQDMMFNSTFMTPEKQPFAKSALLLSPDGPLKVPTVQPLPSLSSFLSSLSLSSPLTLFTLFLRIRSEFESSVSSSCNILPQAAEHGTTAFYAQKLFNTLMRVVQTKPGVKMSGVEVSTHVKEVLHWKSVYDKLLGASKGLTSLRKEERAMVLKQRLTTLEYQFKADISLRQKGKKRSKDDSTKDTLQESSSSSKGINCISLVPPFSTLVSFDVSSAMILKSHAKTPYILTFHDESGTEIPLIFKIGDDVRQDELTLQFFRVLYNGLLERCVESWMYCYDAQPMRQEDGILKVVPHSYSRDQIGKFIDGKLFDYFTITHGSSNSASFVSAQSAFIRSMASYSVATYLVWAKDRHNGNILIDDRGHIVHIDFGFVFGISPGKDLGIESAPFKLTEDMIQVMGGKDSQGFRKFCRLTTRCFLSAREDMYKLFALVAPMVECGFPCFERAPVLEQLWTRFSPNLSTWETIDFIDECIQKSLTSKTTKLYDQFQYLQNDIAY